MKKNIYIPKIFSGNVQQELGIFVSKISFSGNARMIEIASKSIDQIIRISSVFIRPLIPLITADQTLIYCVLRVGHFAVKKVVCSFFRLAPIVPPLSFQK